MEKSLRGDDEPLNKAAEPRKNTAEVTPNSLLEATSPPVPTDRIQSQDVLVIETKEGLSGYSMSLGKWDRVVVGFPKDGRSRLERTIVHNTFAAAIIDDQLFGFSSKVGRWGKMKIPPEYVGKVQPVVGPNLASIKIGDRTYALSPITAEWTSSDEAASSEGRLPQVDLRGAENKLRLALDTSEARRLADEILKYETRAVKLAEQIREFNKGTPVRDKDAAKIVDLRRELDVVLGKALDLKTQVEQLRVKELQARLSRMEQQIGRRQAQRAQIIKRRADELIEGDETKWGDEPTSRPTESFTAGSIPEPGTYQPQPVPAPPQVMTATVEKGTLDSSSRPANPGQKLNIPPEDSNKTVQPQKEVSTTVVANQKRQNEFFVMDEDGSNLRSLFRFGQHPMIGSPSVSPNGEWLAFDDVTTKPGTEQIYVMRLDGGEPRRICSGMMPTWSSDNRFLICTRREPRYGIWRVDTLTEERKFLRMGSGAQMSPDGKKIEVNFNQEIATFDLTTNSHKIIIGGRPNPFVHILSNGTWSPDGKMFCFVGQRTNGQREIYTVTMTGTNDIANLKTHHTYQSNTMTDFAWHPNGHRIVFSQNCPTRQGRKQLYEFDPNVPFLMKLVEGQDESRNNMDVCWTPDGKRLIFVSGDFMDE